MPYASAEAINLVERLCSWDPNNRPTAAKALQHPFFQSCYYVPPSLRTKTSVGQRGSLERSSNPQMVLLLALVRPSGIWRQHGTTKPWEVIMSEMLSIYHRLEGRVLVTSVNMNKKWVFPRGPSDTADKLANAVVGGGRWSQSQRQQQPAMKAGWVGESCDMFLRPTQPPNPYSRRIAG
ncbi:unnamed protein product [Brassica oleracea]